MTEAITDSIQNYLKTIYDLTEQGAAASTNAIAGRLGVEPASVTGMVQKLAAARPALVEYKKHHGVKLTPAGRRAALEVIRHHRLLEAWLVESLGYRWDEVHGEAEKLEHAISEEMEQRIASALGDPLRDPHGEPIPTSDLVMPSDHSIPLETAKAGEKRIVRRVDARDKGLLRHLNQLGLVPGAQVEVLDISEFEHLMRVRISSRKQNTILSSTITAHVYVEDSKESAI
jgi:DtxR family transcriptional regulator, Mn-dependent transcriptional regulator